jgi:hypothetical protein
MKIKDELSGLYWAMKKPLGNPGKSPRGNERR